jgi:hypothetical protein
MKLSNIIWEEAKQGKTILSKKLYNFLNKDSVYIVEDKNVFWFEMVNSHIKMPDYLYYYLKRIGKKHGYTYLYDV